MLLENELSQLEYDREGIRNAHGFTICLSGFPLRRTGNDPDGFCVERGIDAIKNLDIDDTPVAVNDKLGFHPPLDAVFLGSFGINELGVDPF